VADDIFGFESVDEGLNTGDAITDRGDFEGRERERGSSLGDVDVKYSGFINGEGGEVM
jgi:hypothetical protein